MPAFRVLITAIVTSIELVEADDPEQAKRRALAQFEITGEPPQTYELEAAISEELAPVRDTIRGYLPEELCAHHDMPRVYVGGRWKCERCEGAFGGTD